MKVDDKYMGLYEWHRVNPTTDAPDLATLKFTNWISSE